MLQEIVDWFFYTLAGLNSESHIIDALNYFVYDSIKILILLFLMISVVGFLRTYLPQKKVKKWLSKERLGLGNFFASVFGAITPFCSCSSIPIFIGFVRAGVPLGVTFSFLITSPLVNEYLVVLMLGFFGWKITVAYVLFGMLIGIISGFILGKMKLEKHLVKSLFNDKQTQKSKKSNKSEKSKKHSTIKQRAMTGINEAWSITKKLWIWVIVGVGIGALVHNFVPAETIQMVIDKGGIFAVPLAVLLGVPVYGSCVAVIPIALVLFNKGVPLGTALAFMMATSALSLPEAIILRRAMNLKLILIFFGIVSTGIVITGYLFNLFV